METIKTLRDLFRYSTDKFASNIMNSFIGKEPVTYREFGDRVKHVQAVLKTLGIGYGDKVAIYTHNTPLYSVIYFAVTTSGAIIVPLLPDFSPTEIENIVNHSDSKALFISERLKPKIDGCNFPDLQSIMSIDSLLLDEKTVAAQGCFCRFCRCHILTKAVWACSCPFLAAQACIISKNRPRQRC